MRRGVFVSSLLIAGSALCAPALAQAQDKPPEASAAQGEALLVRAEALTARVEAPAAQAQPPAANVEAPVVKAEAPAPKPKPAKPAPLLATPNGQVMDRAREIADADLAAAPEEEIKPLRIDPNQLGKRQFALPRPAPKPADEEQPVLAERASEPQPAVAEARPEPKPAAEAEARPALAEAAPAPRAAPAIADERPALADRETESEPVRNAESKPLRDAESKPLRGGGDPVVKPVYAQRRYEPAEEAEGGDPVVRPTYRQRQWEPKPVQQAERTRAPAPRATEADGRPDYVEAEQIVREVNARASSAPLPAAETGRMASAAPPVAEPVMTAEVSAPVAESVKAADPAPVARAARSAEAEPVSETVQVADAAEEAGDSDREILRDASRAARVVRQAGRVARVLGGAAVGAAADAPVYADEEERDERPVYAEQKREAAPVYAEDEREADRGDPREQRREAPVYAEDAREGEGVGEPVYAQADRDYRPVYADERPLRQRVSYRDRFAGRPAVDSCDDHRYEGLSRAVRRAAEVGSIDWRTARDMEDEIAHGAAMQRSYCESGMNDWRERRLDDQYAQIEDRLRFERRRLR